MVRDVTGLKIESTVRTKLDRLLRPRSIALVGASSTPGSLGECVLTNLEDAGFVALDAINTANAFAAAITD